MLEILCLATASVLHFFVAKSERTIPVSISIITAHHCLSLLHIWTSSKLHIIDTIADALLLAYHSICLVSVGW